LQLARSAWQWAGVEGRKVSSARILIVDDESLIRWSLAQGLSAHGYEVIEAASGAAALEGCEGSNIDVALLDFRLPDTDGIELAREIRRSRPSCPVILMTAYGNPELQRRAAQNGILRVIDKPFDVAELVGLVDHLAGAACSS
jgi:DNA-binding NtrC family response regulator